MKVGADKTMIQIVNETSVSSFSVEHDSDIVDKRELVSKRKDVDIGEGIYNFEAIEFEGHCH